MIEFLQTGMSFGLIAIGAVLTFIAGLACILVVLAILGGIVKGIFGIAGRAGGVSDRGVDFGNDKPHKDDDHEK